MYVHSHTIDLITSMPDYLHVSQVMLMQLDGIRNRKQLKPWKAFQLWGLRYLNSSRHQALGPAPERPRNNRSKQGQASSVTPKPSGGCKVKERCESKHETLEAYYIAGGISKLRQVRTLVCVVGFGPISGLVRSPRILILRFLTYHV